MAQPADRRLRDMRVIVGLRVSLCRAGPRDNASCFQDGARRSALPAVSARLRVHPHTYLLLGLGCLHQLRDQVTVTHNYRIAGVADAGLSTLRSAVAMGHTESALCFLRLQLAREWLMGLFMWARVPSKAFARAKAMARRNDVTVRRGLHVVTRDQTLTALVHCFRHGDGRWWQEGLNFLETMLCEYDTDVLPHWPSRCLQLDSSEHFAKVLILALAQKACGSSGGIRWMHRIATTFGVGYSSNFDDRDGWFGRRRTALDHVICPSSISLTTPALEAVEWLIDRGARASDKALVAAISGGRLDLAQFLLNCPAPVCDCARLTEQCASNAAWSGNIAVCEWVLQQHRNHHKSGLVDNVVWRKWANDAALFGHLPLLEWLARSSPVQQILSLNEVNMAAAGGSIETCEWLNRQTGAPAPTSGTVSHAQGAGHLRVLRWLHNEHGLQPSMMPTYAISGVLSAKRNPPVTRSTDSKPCPWGTIDAEGDDLVAWLCRTSTQPVLQEDVNLVACQGRLGLLEALYAMEHHSATCSPEILPFVDQCVIPFLVRHHATLPTSTTSTATAALPAGTTATAEPRALDRALWQQAADSACASGNLERLEWLVHMGGVPPVVPTPDMMMHAAQFGLCTPVLTNTHLSLSRSSPVSVSAPRSRSPHSRRPPPPPPGAGTPRPAECPSSPRRTRGRAEGGAAADLAPVGHAE